MSQVLQFRAVKSVPPTDIAALSARLVQLETAETSDE